MCAGCGSSGASEAMAPEAGPVAELVTYDGGNPAPMLAFDGNSIVYGINANPLTEGFAAQTAARFLGWSHANNAVSGYTTPQVDAISTMRTDPLYLATRPRNVVVMLEGLNDYWQRDAGAAGCVADLAAYVAHRRAVGWTVVMLTVLPSAYLPENVRATINDAIRAPSFVDAVADVGADPVMGDPASLGNTALYADKTHPTSLGHSLLVPTVFAAIQAIIR